MIVYESQRPYIASFIVFRDGSKIAMVHRQNTAWMNNYWGLPSGKVECNESFIDGAIREAGEEVGLSVNKADLSHLITVHRHSEDKEGNVMEWVDVYFEARRWTGKFINAEPHMHSDAAWFDILDLPENTIPSVRASLAAAEMGEQYLDYGFNEITE